MTNEQWFYDAGQMYVFCRELERRGATYWRALDRDMTVVRWIEYWQWKPTQGE